MWKGFIRTVTLSKAMPIAGLIALLSVTSAHGQFDPLECEAQGFPYFCAMSIAPSAFEFGSLTWGDLDGNGRMDLVYTGNRVSRENPEPEMQFLLNVGDAVVIIPPPDESKPPSANYISRYSELTVSAALPPSQRLWDGATLVSDLTGNGRLDIVATGQDDVGAIKTLIYGNTINQTQEFVLRQSLSGVVLGSMVAADLDNDGDTDLAVTGQGSDDAPVLLLLRNDLKSTDEFTETAIGLDGVTIGSIDVADFDGDNDNDLLLSGKSQSNDSVTLVYRNDNGSFVESGIALPGLLFSRARFADIDSDGDPDIVLTGGRLSPFVLSGAGIVLENVNGSFSESASFAGRYYGGLTVGDIDSDGSTDILVGGGERVSGVTSTAFYSNSSNGTVFTEESWFGGGLFGSGIIADYDGDNDLDLLIYGKLEVGGNRLIQYRNEGAPANTEPAAPPNLQSTVAGTTVNFTWDAGADTETPAAALTYNLRVGTSPDSNDVMPSNAGNDGRRLLSAPGNVGASQSWMLTGLPSGTYYWSVQTIDSAFIGSAFSAPSTFVIP